MNQSTDLQKEVSMLREYTKALESENESRNRERKTLEIEIERLSKIEKNQSLAVCTKCPEYKEKISEIEKQLAQQKFNLRYLKVENERIQKELRENSKLKQNNSTAEYQELSQKLKKVESQFILIEEENKSLRVKVQTYERNSSQTSEQTNKIKNQRENLKSKVSILETEVLMMQNRIKDKDQQITRIKADYATLQSSSKRVVVNSSQIAKYAEEIKNFQSILDDKEHIIRSLQDQNYQKNQQVKKLDNIVSQYMQKINKLSEELQRIEASNNFNVDVASINHQNNALNAENFVLNQKIIDLQRRIQILQETNLNLQDELRYSIQMRKSTSNMNITHHSQSDQELKQLVKELRSQLQEARENSYEIKVENQRMQAKLSEIQISRSPKSKTGSSNFSFELRRDSEPVSFKAINETVMKEDPHKSRGRKNFSKSEYDTIQSKINNLKKENAGLKKQLFQKR